MAPEEFFSQYSNSSHKQYEALRALFVDKKTAQQVAIAFGYTKQYVYTLVARFKKNLKDPANNPFFKAPQNGRSLEEKHPQLRATIVNLRKQHCDVATIKATLAAQHIAISHGSISAILRAEGLTSAAKQAPQSRSQAQGRQEIIAPKAQQLPLAKEVFVSPNAGILAFMPYIKRYGIDQLIEHSQYPATEQLSTCNAVFAFLALKLANISRYAADDLWCMDRGMGLFAGLNVLPTARWFTDYAHRVSRTMNVAFLKDMHALWQKHKLLSDTTQLAFVPLPCWKQAAYPAKKQALTSQLVALAQDPNTGLLTYGDMAESEDKAQDVVLAFLEAYRQVGNAQRQCLVFDSQYTTYEHLRKLDEQGVKFVTMRQRGKQVLATLMDKPSTAWTKVKVLCGQEMLSLWVNDQGVLLKGYGKPIRQIAILGYRRAKLAVVLTNDFGMKTKEVVRKYATRWLVEKKLTEQLQFFHLNRLSSSMAVKVDFDLTMTLLAYNLYRLLGRDLAEAGRAPAQRLYEKHLCSAGQVERLEQEIIVRMGPKRGLSSLIACSRQYASQQLPWLGNQVLRLAPSPTS